MKAKFTALHIVWVVKRRILAGELLAEQRSHFLAQKRFAVCSNIVAQLPCCVLSTAVNNDSLTYRGKKEKGRGENFIISLEKIIVENVNVKFSLTIPASSAAVSLLIVA